MLSRALILIPFMMVCACAEDKQTLAAPKDAGTPARYILCSAGGQNCFVSARFSDLPACERHKEWSAMLCDSMSTLGEMTCERDAGEQLVEAYCSL